MAASPASIYGRSLTEPIAAIRSGATRKLEAPSGSDAPERWEAAVARVVVVCNLTLDGVMQAPARPDEDTRDGFAHGGWAVDHQDPAIGRRMGEMMANANGALLLGRRTYEDFYAVWPNRTDNPYSDHLNKATKYVASRTLTAPLAWQNAILLEGDAGDAVAALKQEREGDLTVLGSGDLVGTLARRGLVDEYVLTIAPVVLGSGRRLFPAGLKTDLRLVDSLVGPSGVILASYRPS